MLSAHLDHIGVRANAPAGADAINNGADDDASGTIAVLELARALALGPRPKRTIVFAFFGSEEAGGFGSGYFADKPVVPLTQIVANLQFEMIGRPDDKVPPHTLWLTGYERSTLGPALAKQGAKLVQDPHPEQNFFERSDNIQFARRGVVAHTVSSYGMHKEYHQPSDEIKIDRLRAHDRRDPVDAGADPVARQFGVQAGLAAGEEAVDAGAARRCAGSSRWRSSSRAPLASPTSSGRTASASAASNGTTSKARPPSSSPSASWRRCSRGWTAKPIAAPRRSPSRRSRSSSGSPPRSTFPPSSSDRSPTTSS